jgi:GT2 family glycosyltransferase
MVMKESAAADATNRYGCDYNGCKTEMKTAVVILNWNTKEFLEKFLPGLISSVEKVDGAEVVVADNASTDGSMEMMAEKFPNVKTLVFEKNLGFTGGYNRAFKEIHDSVGAPEYFLLINSDIEVPEGWLQPLVEWMDEHPGCGACAPKLHSWQEREKFEYAGAAGGYIDSFGYPLCRGRVLKMLETDRGQYDTPKDVFWATGACLLVRSKVFRELGGLDDRFFAHMEEIDLCWRMQMQGWKVTVVPESVVYHVGGGTLPATSPFKLFLNYRNNKVMLMNNLAKTIALQHFNSKPNISQAARIGYRKAGRIIAFRGFLDRISAFVYLLTGKIECFKATVNARKQAKELSHKTTLPQIEAYLLKYGGKAQVTGIYRGSMILRAIIKGKNIFKEIESKII